MLLSAVSILVVAQSSSEIPEGLMNNHVDCNPVYSGMNLPKFWIKLAPLPRNEAADVF